MLKIIGTAILTAFVTSMFWIWFYNFVPSSPAPEVARSGNVVTVKPDQAPPVSVAQQLAVAPSGLAIPVLGIKAEQLTDTFDSARGGITIYERSPDQKWTYYYAHLSAYAPGLAEGQQVKRGQVIGRVGHTGDASAAGPHLHFAINSMAPGERWWNGRPINPYPLLAGK
jgi:peptidoglycan LD-endopeptidase LytH